MKRVFPATLIIGLFLGLNLSCGPRRVKVDYGREAVSYLERKLVWQKGKKVFVAFALFGTAPAASQTAVYGWCLRHGFSQRDDQVIHEDAASLPLAVLFRRRRDGSVEGAGLRQPELGQDFAQSAKKVFPKQYWPRVLGGQPATLAHGVRARVVSYYRARMPKDRFFRQAPPAIFSNAHRHYDDIYGYLNLKSAYRNVKIKPDPAEVVRTGGEGPVLSPDGRFEAWTGVDQGRHLYFRDTRAGITYEVVNRVTDWQIGLAWKEDGTLIYDQINGINTFGDGLNNGVHIEIDAPNRKIVWAAPFGPLGFPRKM